MLTDTSFHRRSNPQSLMNSREVVPHVEQRNGMNVVLDLFAKAVDQAGKAPHGHTHGQVLALDIASRNMFRIGRTKDRFLSCAKTLRGAVRPLSPRIGSVNLHKLRIVDLIGKGVNDGVQVNLVPVAAASAASWPRLLGLLP